jgi:YVTN family beta-propeller protein
MTNERRYNRVLLAGNFRAGILLVLVCVACLASLPAIASASPLTPFAYVTNANSLTGNSVSVINTATNAVVATVPVGASPLGVATMPDGAFIYVADQLNDSVSVIDTSTNTVVATVSVGDAPNSIAITPSGAFAYVVNESGKSVSVINTATNAVVATVPVGQFPASVAITPNGDFAYVADGFKSESSDSIQVIETATNTVVDTVPLHESLDSLAITPNGASVYATEPLGESAAVIDTATNTVEETVPVGESPLGLAITPDGAFTYVANEHSHNVSVINTSTNAVAETVPVEESPHGLAITPDGAHVYVANGDSDTISVIDMATNEVVATVPGGSQPWGVAITPPIEGQATPPEEPGGSPAPAPTPAPSPSPIPRHKKHRKCHKGFKKRKVHGKTRCVKVKGKHHPGQGRRRASPRQTLAARPHASLSWTFPHGVNKGASIPFSWTGSHLGRKYRLVVQRPVGTARTWRTMLKLGTRSGSAELPGLTLGKYRFRLAALRGHRVLAQQVAGIGVFGQVPFSTLFRGGYLKTDVFTPVSFICCSAQAANTLPRRGQPLQHRARPRHRGSANFKAAVPAGWIRAEV